MGGRFRRRMFGNRLSERSRSKSRAHHVEEAKRLKFPEEVKKWGERVGGIDMELFCTQALCHSLRQSALYNQACEPRDQRL